MYELAIVATAIYYEMMAFIKPGYAKTIADEDLKKAKQKDSEQTERNKLAIEAIFRIIFGISYMLYTLAWCLSSNIQIKYAGIALIILSITTIGVRKILPDDSSNLKVWLRIDAIASLTIVIIVFKNIAGI